MFRQLVHYVQQGPLLLSGERRDVVHSQDARDDLRQSVLDLLLPPPPAGGLGGHVHGLAADGQRQLQGVMARPLPRHGKELLLRLPDHLDRFVMALYRLKYREEQTDSFPLL